MPFGAILSPSTDGAIGAARNASGTVARESVNQSYADNVPHAFRDTAEPFQLIQAESHMGLSSGNPVSAASIKEGENVLNLGSGSGIDVFLAATKVGRSGQVVGLDMSPDMISLARQNASKRNSRPPRVSFVQALLHERLPINSESVDCVLSNSVINLLPIEGKAMLLKEVYRVLKPGGRVVLDDIIAKKRLPQTLRSSLQVYVGCVAGALQLDEYRDLAQKAGFQDTIFLDTKRDLNAYAQEGSVGCCTSPDSADTSCGSSVARSASSIGHQIEDVNEWAASYQIYATKQANISKIAENVGPRMVLECWQDAYPLPQSKPPSMTIEEVAELLRSVASTDKSRDFAVIDVRRDDHPGGHVRGSHQRVAQSFYDDLAGFFDEFKDTEKVIFYCDSSSGREPRCAGWYQDYLDSQGNTKSEAFIMAGGVKAWLAKFSGDDAMVDEN